MLLISREEKLIKTNHISLLEKQGLGAFAKAVVQLFSVGELHTLVRFAKNAFFVKGQSQLV